MGAGYDWVNDWGMIEKGRKQGFRNVLGKASSEGRESLCEEHG